MPQVFDTLDPPGQNKPLIQGCGLLLILLGLYFTSWVNYLLFHTLAEFFSIVVAVTIFVIAWHSRHYIQNPYLLFIGIAYLFISLLDLLHTLSYKGMPIFTDYDYYANQLWIGARYLESITLALAFLFLKENKQLKVAYVISAYALVTYLIIAAIFEWKIFPVCFVDGSGLTPFKKDSEYLICLILLAAIIFLRLNKSFFERKIYRLILLSIICTIISELSFTFYISNYGISNLVGHYFKIFSFYLIYLCIIKTGIERPYRLIFTDLKRTNDELVKEIRQKEDIQKKNEGLIEELKQALREIKSLQGILPICSSCKQIRDDKGAWNQLERYIETHADVKFSHGLCRTCADKMYGDQKWYQDGRSPDRKQTT